MENSTQFRCSVPNELYTTFLQYQSIYKELNGKHINRADIAILCMRVGIKKLTKDVESMQSKLAAQLLDKAEKLQSK
jgi:hypothetical protein